MPTPQREPLCRLSRTERVALERIARSTSERVDQVRRATALLAVVRTGVFIHAARELVGHARRRWAHRHARIPRYAPCQQALARQVPTDQVHQAAQARGELLVR
jgi:hypothetical protein